ncbi:MAG TPA: GNAT family N-acetyltransferase [Phycisphaerae bacterium]|nr:GNAT family N-acetyltransferase [Phycisphaerae bacterium]
MNLAEIRQRLDDERRTLALDAEVLVQLPAVTRLRTRDGSHYSISFSRLTTDNADAAISNEVEYHRHLGVKFEWKLYAHDSPPDLLDRLKSHGLNPGPMEAVLVCDITDPPPWLREPIVHHVERIETPQQVDIFRRLEDAIFGQRNGSNADALAEAVRSGSSQHRGYIAYSATEPAGIGRLYTHPQSHFAGLYGGGTHPAHRSQGFYRALIAARAVDARQLGARYLLVDALPTSRPILERLGLQWLTDTWPCQWKP